MKTAIPRNPELVYQLIGDHKGLMLKYNEVLNYAQNKQYLELQSALSNFSGLITKHFSNERELYMYLELVVSNSDGTYTSTRAEMKDIAVSIHSTINLHENMSVNDDTVDKFMSDFGQLGKDLLGRMRFEERHLFNDYSKHIS
jgi:hypothetical protein